MPGTGLLKKTAAKDGEWSCATETRAMLILGSQLVNQDVAAEALHRLRIFGYPERLKELLAEEEAVDVRERAENCLARFEQGAAIAMWS